MKNITKKLLTAAMAATLASAGAQAANLSDGKLKIGVLADMGGTYADLCGPGCVKSVEMAVEDFGGTVLGQPIEIVTADSQLKPDVASAKAREWVDNEQVDTITGLVSSGVTTAVAKLMTEKKKIILISTAASNAFTAKPGVCSPYNVQWVYDVVALSNGTVKSLVADGKKKWFFITADYTFGHALEGTASEVVKESGGEVLGAVRAPLGTTDFSSYVLQAQASGAEAIGLANAGTDFINSLKTAAEFGLTESATVAGLLVFTPSAMALDPAVAGGMNATVGFYWDMDDQTRAWSKRFKERHGSIPSMSQAGIYSMVTHYLTAVKETGTDDSDTVMKWMKANKPNDFFSRNAYLRGDGRMVHDMLLVRIKKGDERKNSDDIFAIEKVIPGEVAFAPMVEACNFSK